MGLRLQALDDIAFELVVKPGVAPGASVAVAVRGTAWTVVTGAAGTRRRAGGGAVSPDTPFDLASVTKPFTAVALARQAGSGGFALDDPAGRHVAEARGTPTEHVTLELLLAHRAGLAAHLPLYDALLQRRVLRRDQMLRRAAEGRRSDCAGRAVSGGFAPVYSDLGYLLAGEALARAAGRPLDAVIEDAVCQPLGLDVGSARRWLCADPRFLARVAATEHVPWRGGELVGVVHDENAWAFAGHGSAGHAGLFGSAGSVVRFGAAMLDALSGRRPEFLAAAEAARLVTPRPGGTLRAGFDAKSAVSSAAGSRCSMRTFGHLGFTGTSLWCDPDADVAVVLLTNRVCPTRDHALIRDARPAVHDALFAAGSELRAAAAAAPHDAGARPQG